MGSTLSWYYVNYVMNMTNQYILKLVSYFSLCSLLVGCLQLSQPEPIRIDDISVNSRYIKILPIDRDLVVHMNLSAKNKVTNCSKCSMPIPEGEVIEQTATDVFNKLSKNVVISNVNNHGHILVCVNVNSHIDKTWGKYSSEVSTQVIGVNGEVIGRYSGNGESQSDLLNDLIAFENSYIEAFLVVVNQIVNDEVFVMYINDINLLPAPLPLTCDIPDSNM